jgi:hypothetical protein
LQFLIEKKKKKISALFFILFLVIKTLNPHWNPEPDPHPDSLGMLDPDAQNC